jgi:hypothetical protein
MNLAGNGMTMLSRLIIAAILLVPTLLVGQSADSIVDDYLKAIGGEEKLKQVKSLYLSGTTYTESLPLEVRLFIVPPDRAYNELLMEGLVFSSGGANGENAWQVTPLGTFYLSDDLKESAQQQADFFPLLGYRERGLKLEFLGEAFVKGKKAYKLQVVGPDSDTSYCYFEIKTHYLLKQENSFGSVVFSKYRSVGDLTLCHKLNSDGPEGELLVTFDSIAVNIPVADSLFVMPADVEPLPERLKP